MAESKKSFILYADLLHTVEKMPIDKAGELFKTILEYVNDKDPQPDDLLISLVFEPIKQQLKRDLNKWNDGKDTKSRNGAIGNLKRWNTDLYEQFITNKISLDDAISIANSRKASGSDNNHRKQSQEVANIAVNVNDTVNVSVNDNVTVIKKERDKENPSLSEIDLALTKKIMDWFGFNEISNFDKFRQVADFQRCLVVQNKIEHFKTQFSAYTEFKSIEPKFKHSFSKFLGSQKILYEDGKWNDENWIEILKNEKLKGNGAKNQGSGIRSNKPIFVSGDTYTDL